MAPHSEAAATQGSFTAFNYPMTTSQAQQQGTGGSYGGHSSQMTSQAQSPSSQGYYNGNSPYYQNIPNDPSSQFYIGASAQDSQAQVPLKDLVSQQAQQTDQYYNAYSSTSGLNERKKRKQGKGTSYQMERFLSQQPKEDHWHYGSRG